MCVTISKKGVIMAYSTKEIVSEKLANNYPAYYLEMQVQNWTRLPIVATDRNGQQEVLQQVLTNQDVMHPGYVACEWRFTIGERCSPGIRASYDKAIPGGRIEIPLNDIKVGPVYVKEVDLVFSTVEMATIAIHPSHQNQFIEQIVDTPDAYEMCSNRPTFSFTANDPTFTYSKLYVYVFGRIVEVPVKATTFVESPFRKVNPEDISGVFLTFRQGVDEIEDATIRIPLDNIDTPKPCEAVDGTAMLIASSEAKLRDLIKERHECDFDKIRGMLNTSKIISKEVYEKAMKMADERYESLQKKHTEEMKTLEESHKLQEQKLKNEAESYRMAKEAAEQQVEMWKSIHSARVQADKQEAEARKKVDEARNETYAADQKRIERDMAILKIVATAAAGVISFSIAAFTKNTKK